MQIGFGIWKFRQIVLSALFFQVKRVNINFIFYYYFSVKVKKDQKGKVLQSYVKQMFQKFQNMLWKMLKVCPSLKLEFNTSIFLHIWPASVPKLLTILELAQGQISNILFQKWILDEKNKVFNRIQTANTHSIKDPTTVTTICYCYYSCKLSLVTYSVKNIFSAGLPLPLPTAAVV